MKNTIYLITSTSFRQIEEEIKKIVNDHPYTVYDYNSISLDDILEEASYFSLFDEKKYIIVKNANIFSSSRKKADNATSSSKKDESLLNYLNSPNENTIIIFTLIGNADSKKRITKQIKEKYNLISLNTLKPKEIFTKLQKELKNEGYTCDYNTLYYIINNCQNNYDLIVNEISKIKLYYSEGCTIQLNDVKNIISNQIEENNFKFIDVIMQKNIKEAFKIYDDLMLQKIEPIMLLNMLSKEIRNTLLTKKLLYKKDKNEIMKTLNINYEFQIDKIINNSYSFTIKELEDYLTSLCTLDYKIKTGKISNKLALETFILDICR